MRNFLLPLLSICLFLTNHSVAQSTQFGAVVNASPMASPGCGITVTFNTVTEHATDMMRIERSKDNGNSYIEIGTSPGHQAANGLAGSGYSYTFIDQTPLSNGTAPAGLRYRIRTKKYDTYGPWVVSNPSNTIFFSNPCNQQPGSLCTGTPRFWGFGSTPGLTGPFTACMTPSIPIQIVDVPSQTIVWSSSNPSVATVDANNFLVINGQGSAVITATMPACGYSISKTFDICPCNPVVPNSLGGNWGQGACQLWWNRIGGLSTYTLEWVNLLTNAGGSKVVTYNGATYPFTDLPYQTPFKFRVAATTTTPCTTTDFSDWYTVIQTSSCSAPTVPTLIGTNCVCGPSCAGSCGYQRFNWTSLTNHFEYQVEYEIQNMSGTVLATHIFNISYQPPTVQPIPNYYSYPSGSTRIRFRVRARCVDGIWGAFSGWSNPVLL